MSTVTIEDEDGNEVELPGREVQCWRCKGKGMVTNPSIGAISAEEWERDWDCEERERYMQGVYDVHCPECGGKGTLTEVNTSRLSASQRELYESWQESERIRNEPDWEQIAERRAGA
jgi:DnaJ-class molecular chaperone